uniref:Homeodomain interacting protein kinase 4 n=1 Tax=Strigops habroptila TaxID=2489341 RepID=A0A672V5W6_STRHB
MGTPTARAELYDVVAAVGKGTFGEVARGRRRSTGEHVAIKILPSTGHRGRVARNELRLLRAFSDASCTYLVLELLQQNLLDFQKLRRFSPLPARHIRTIAAQVLAALVKLEELSIIHADLKPENIMLVDHARFPFRVKLIDFGSGCLVADVAHVKEPYIQSRFYRAPEILLGLPFNERMDVWSLGCVLAELHLGWPLYPGASEYEQVSYICSTLGLPPFVFSSLDQLGTVPRAPEPAERRDRHRMVELLKGMLTWDPLQRLGPSAETGGGDTPKPAPERRLTDVRRLLRHHVLVVVDAGVGDPRLRRTRRHHEEPLRGVRPRSGTGAGPMAAP